jgi:ATP-dependent helicase/nuclease subunit A
VETIQWFLATELGTLLRENESRVMREMPVYASVTATGTLAAAEPGSPEAGLDLMMVRGRADLFLPLLHEGVLVDYKTDRVRNDQHLQERIALYEPQLQAYASTIERITGQPVKQRWLVFLSARRLVAV